MSHFGHRIPLFFFGVILTFACNSQIDHRGPDHQRNADRQPAVAGQFYPGDSAKLKRMLSALFESAQERKVVGVQSIIVPHAGYIFSGIISASAYNQLDPMKPIQNVFIIASSHYVYFDGASVYSKGNYHTPLGKVNVNAEIAQKLIDDSNVFEFVQNAHQKEHSIEVQLPFLQYIYGGDLKIVPIVIGANSADECKMIAQELKPYLVPENLFVISTDFSHYPDYAEARKWDGKTADSILTNSSDSFISAIHDSADDQVRNLVTRACGWTSLLTLLYMTEGDPRFQYQEIEYRNSGDSEYGDEERVVGYYSLALIDNYQLDSESGLYRLSSDEKSDLLRHARLSIIAHLSNTPQIETGADLTDALLEPSGAFVTLHYKGELRGCIGSFSMEDPLYHAVEKMAIAAATEDPRFQPLTLNEMKDVKIEISVLTPLKRIYSTSEIILGRHGIYIKMGMRSGTFLPQVADETGWNLEEFLGHCSRDKAGIGWDGWREAELYTYEAIIFSE